MCNGIAIMVWEKDRMIKGLCTADLSNAEYNKYTAGLTDEQKKVLKYLE